MEISGMGKARLRMILTAQIVVSILASSGSVIAQFHSKNSSGRTGVNQQAVNAAENQAAMNNGGIAPDSIGGGTPGVNMSGGDVILPEATKEALKENKVQLTRMQGKNIDVWGRAIHHGDGSYTESKQDVKSNTLEQITKSKNGVKLQRRMVSLDPNGRPAESLIYDGREQLKYRGTLIYDQIGRFSEEQIFDAKGTLIRRRVQQYGARGEKMPLRSWDYVANIPDDLKLVITRDDAAAASEAPKPFENPTSEKRTSGWKGLFRGKKKE